MPDQVQHKYSSFHVPHYKHMSSLIWALQTSVHIQSYQAYNDGTN